MNKSRLASFLDTCLVSFSCMFILIIIFSKLGFGLILRLILSAFLSAIIFVVFYAREKRRYVNQKLKIKEQKHFNLTFLAIDLMTTQEKKEFFKTLFNKIENTIILEDKQSSKIMYNANSYFSNSINDNYIQKTIDETKTNEFDTYYVLINDSKNKSSILEKHKEIIKKNIIELSREDLFTLMKKYDYFPNTTHIMPASLSIKAKSKLFFENLLYKRNYKGFFFSGLLIFITSLYLPYYKNYYTTISLILFSVSAICLIFGKKHPREISK